MVGFIVLKKESTYICATYRKCMNAMKNYTYHLVAVLTVGIWGLTFISTKVLIGHGLSPQEIFLLRFLIAYMGIWLISPRKLFADNWKDEFWMFLGGITGGSFYFFTENTALEITLATNVSFIVCTAPLLTTILSLWIYKKEKEENIRCLCPKCLSEYIDNPNYIVRRLDPFAKEKDRCDKCDKAGWDYVVTERSSVRKGKSGSYEK